MSAARDFFASLPERVGPDQLGGVNHTYLFDITGAGRWLVQVTDGAVTVTENPEEERADASFTMSAETFERIQARKQNPMVAMMTGKLKVSGDMTAAMALRSLL